MVMVSRVRQRLRSGLAGESGSASVELVVVVPLVLLMLLAIVQFALWSHATHVAQAAASYGLAATRVDGGSPAAGRVATYTILAQLGDGPLRHATVSVDRGAAQARVRVSGTVVPVIPFLTLPVHGEAVGPVEQVAAP